MGLTKGRMIFLHGSCLIASCKMYKRNTFGIIWPLTRDSFVEIEKETLVMEKEKRKESKNVRSKIITLRMNEQEFLVMVDFRQKTTEKTNSNYLRKLSQHKPVVFKTRNVSIDELSAEIIRMRKEINYIGHNFNQAVHKLHTLDKIPEFRHWVQQYDATRMQLKMVAEQTFTELIRRTQTWLQG